MSVLSRIISILYRINDAVIVVIRSPSWTNFTRDTDATQITNKPSFTNLPFEIRAQIYEHLLVLDSPVQSPGSLVQSRLYFEFDPLDSLVRSRLHFTFNPLERPTLQVAILQTCRQVYEEALPVLYGLNRFVFGSPECIRAFHFAGLASGMLFIMTMNVLVRSFEGM